MTAPATPAYDRPRGDEPRVAERSEAKEGDREIRRDVFGCFLFAKRLFRGLSRAEVAGAAGVSPATVARAEAQARLSAESFRRLCAWQGEEAGIFLAQEAGSEHPRATGTEQEAGSRAVAPKGPRRATGTKKNPAPGSVKETEAAE